MTNKLIIAYNVSNTYDLLIQGKGEILCMIARDIIGQMLGLKRQNNIVN